MNERIIHITNKIIERSRPTRELYLHEVNEYFIEGVKRQNMHCGNLAHAIAGCGSKEKVSLSKNTDSNIGIITAYNDMLSAHKVYEDYPEKIRLYALKHGGVAQVAGGVPAMCDGVTQGQPGMELSLYSRDVIALSTAIGMSHNMFDAAVCLGICDKIVPGLLMGALKFGHLPFVFVPGGPMPSGISNDEKASIRQAFAEGKIGRDELLKGESDSYHSPGTCTFYGTANSNQMLMEIMGLQLPSSSFVNPYTQHRTLLDEEAIRTAIMNSKDSKNKCISRIVSEKTIVNGIIGLLATGGSTNHTIHLIAIARAAGIIINWEDMSELSEVIPLITRMYPNGAADINHFHASGGMSFVIKTLLDNGLLHRDVTTILGEDLYDYTQESCIVEGKLAWKEGALQSLNDTILRSANSPFSTDGGIKILKGNIGRCVIKTAAVAQEHRIVQAKAEVFHEQSDLIEAFKAGKLNKDFIAVLPFQGPKYNGMPELHQLTPTLTVLQKKGFKVGLITDGRMSGASGKVPAAIHVTPEALDGGGISKIQTGDLLLFDANNGVLHCLEEGFESRKSNVRTNSFKGLGRSLFQGIQKNITSSEEGASFVV